MIKWIFMLFICAHVWGQDNIPDDSDSVQDLRMNFRVFKKVEDINYMVELSNTIHEDRNDERWLLVGFKKRLYSNIKLGFYLGSVQGVRHDDDWVVSDGKWKWRSSENRSETFAIGESTLRWSFVWWEWIWVGELRARYVINTEFSEQTLRLRPGVTTTLNNNGSAFVTLSLQHETYHPLNYGQVPIYGSWTYLGSLFHISNSFKAGPFLAVGYESWTDSDEFKQKVDEKDYEVREAGALLGANINYYF